MTQRRRNQADISRPNIIQFTISIRCVDAIMHMLRHLYSISDKNNYSNVARGMIMIANSTPIKCVCIDISPYENGIIPSFATALAYSPRLCVGVPPSVQVLSQSMSLCAISIKDRYANKHPDHDSQRYLTRDQYTTKFAMMLRCSYSCAEAGVAFVNTSLAIAFNAAKTAKSMSSFSE